MARITYVYIDGVAYVKGTEPHCQASGSSAPTIIGDQPDFVSPVDGKLYSGRAGRREHNLRNDVVDNRDLVGLPILTTNSDFRSPQEKRASAEQRKQTIVNLVNKHYR